MIMFSSLDGVWVNWFNAGTGFWECNRIWNLFDIGGIFGKVWENVSLFLSLLMVLPYGFYIIRFLRRKILLNSFSGTSLIICSLMYLISLVVILDCWRFLFGLMMDGFCYFGWHGLFSLLL